METATGHNHMANMQDVDLNGGGPVPKKSGPNQALSMESWLAELPIVHDGQHSLSELLSRVVQAIYAEMTEFAETMPTMSDAARKRTLADFCVKTKKQVAKLYAVMRWSRDADAVQRCMNITAFVMSQGRQLDEVLERISWTKDIMAPAQLRNHDLLTSLDVLTTGTYRRLPSAIKDGIFKGIPVSNDEVSAVLHELDNQLRFRMRVLEIVPKEMSHFRIEDGRAYFFASNLFEAAVSLRGTSTDDGWFFIQVEFLFGVAGEGASILDFPKKPNGLLKQFMEDEANSQLSYYSPKSFSAEAIIPEQPVLPPGVVDAPLIRLYNFLQMMSLSYQLEALFHQATRLSSLGWSDHLVVEMSNDRKAFKTYYWVRKPVGLIHSSSSPQYAGAVTVSVEGLEDSGPPSNSSETVMSELNRKALFHVQQHPSDRVERLQLSVKWEPSSNIYGLTAIGATTAGRFHIDSENLDFEMLIKNVILKHTEFILFSFRDLLLGIRNRPTCFLRPDEVVFASDQEGASLHVTLTPESVLRLAIDSRTGLITFRDTGGLSAGSRNLQFAAVATRLNEQPKALVEIMSRLRYTTILDSTEQKVSYLGLQCFRRINLQREELLQFGGTARGFLFVQLAASPGHYLTIVAAEDGFKYALIETGILSGGPNMASFMKDIGWIDAQRLKSRVSEPRVPIEPSFNFLSDIARSKDAVDITLPGFHLDIAFLRELYSYCCNRVAHLSVERQLKERGFLYSHVLSHPPLEYLPNARGRLADMIPALCVKSRDILAGAEAAEAAEENVRIIPLVSWGKVKTQVLTCVKLRHVQSTMGKATSSSQRIIRPSRYIMYDTQEGIVSVLSSKIQDCIAQFLSEWSKVSKMVVIAREVAQMSQSKTLSDMSVLLFDLQTIEFVYSSGYALAITCRSDSKSKSFFSLRFFRPIEQPSTETDSASTKPNNPADLSPGRASNPHTQSSPWALRILEGYDLSSSARRLVGLLRMSLPVVLELESLRLRFNKKPNDVDWLPKGMASWRLIFGDLRHALDFRIRPDALLEISDSSHTPFRSSQGGHNSTMPFKPIPRMGQVCRRLSLISPLKVMSVDSGLLCSCNNAARPIRKLIGDLVEGLSQDHQGIGS